MTGYDPNVFRQLLQASMRPKRCVFVSYHHDFDQGYYNAFSQTFSATVPCVTDNSLDRACDSDNCDYVLRRIRERYISGTSCTFALVGWETRWRKYVDWEIRATLEKEHGLIGVELPTAQRDQFGRCHKPDRLQDNIDSGYALWVPWAQLTPTTVPSLVEQAVSKSKSLIRNLRPMRGRNGM